MHLTAASPDAPSTPTFAMDSFWSMIKRRRGLAIVCGSLAALGALMGFSLVRPLYQAEATLVMDRATRSLSEDENGRQIDYSFLNTQRELLMSDAVLTNALAASGSLAREPYAQSPDPNAILRHRLSMIVSKDSWMITVSLRDESPSNARTMLALVLHSYAHHEIDLRQNRMRGDLDFLNHQVEKEREVLIAARMHEQEFRASHGILTADPDRSPLASQMESYGIKRVELSRELEADRVVVGQLVACDAIPDAETRTRSLLEIAVIKQDAAVAQHREALAKLQDKAVELGQKYKSKHPRMLEITSQIVAEQTQLVQAIGIARSAVENRERALTQENEAITKEIGKLQDALTGYRNDLMAMEALSAERGANERIYANLLAKLRQAEIDSRLVPSQLMTIDAPHAGIRPVNVHWPLFLLATAIISAIVAIIAVIIAESFDHRIADADMAGGIAGLEILGDIPRIAGLQPMGRRGDPRITRGPSAADRVLDESFNALRVNLRLGEEIDHARVLMIASGSPRDGRSTVAARLGRSMAANGLRVLLIDGDVCHPSLDRQVGEECSLGFGEWLNGDERVKPMRTACTGLDIIAGGNSREAIQLQGRRLRHLIDGMRPNYDCIILDSPPIRAAADALVEATVVDNILLIVRGRHTTREQLAFTLHRLGWMRQKILGIVFNDDPSASASLDPVAESDPAQARGSEPSAMRDPVIAEVAAARQGQRAGA